MKKFAALVLALMMVLSLVPMASADEPIVIRYGTHWTAGWNPNEIDPATGTYTMTDEADRQLRLKAEEAVLLKHNVKIEHVQYYTRYFDPEGAHLASELATTFIDANKQILLDRVKAWYAVPVTTDMTFDALKQAGILIFLAPLVVLYLFAQRWLVENLENSGLVG